MKPEIRIHPIFHASLLFMGLALSACGPTTESTDVAAIPVEAAKVEENALRIASFNIAMGMQSEGELSQALQEPEDSRLRALAEIIQRVRPDVLVLNEFDFDPDTDAVMLLNRNFLGVSQNGLEQLSYAYSFRAPVNTGVDSGLDLDGNGVLHAGADAWGFGVFPGQYGMLLLSRFPIDAASVRTFQDFPWSQLPGARQPLNEDGSPYYSPEIWQQLRLSSKSHWDVVIEVAGQPLHMLLFHPTPPVFDGPEDRNGIRNFDEIRFWVDYLDPARAEALVDDQGQSGGVSEGEAFVIAGDFNSDPFDGDSIPGSVGQLLDHPGVNASCVPISEGASEASRLQGGMNLQHRGNPAADTSDFNDEYTGNLRLDYLLPSSNLIVSGCGVFWPPVAADEHELVEVSDHRLVWLDIGW